MIHSVPVRTLGLLDEEARLEALTDADVLGPVPPAELQALVTLAAEIIGSAAFLTLIDKDTLYAGISSVAPLGTLPRCDTVCDRVIRQAEPGVMQIENLQVRPEFANSAPTRMGLRFYAGVPVHAPDRHGWARPLGALCVMSDAARVLDDAAQASLLRLAQVADALLAARAAAKRATEAAQHQERLAIDLARRNRVLAQAERLTHIGSWRLSLPGNELHWSPGVWQIYGLPLGEAPTLEQGLSGYLPDAQARVMARLAQTAETGRPFDFEEDFYPVTGGVHRVRCVGEREDVDGVGVGIIGVFQDVTDRWMVEAMLRRDASTDVLTGLPNRQGFGDALSKAMVRAEAGAPLVLAMMDLDGFKEINDRHGHAAGDQVLQAIGTRLLTEAPRGTLPVRLGGDEFAVIIEEPTLCADPARITELFGALLRVPVEAEPGRLSNGTVGWAIYCADLANTQAFMRAADASLYAGKRQRIAEWRRGERRDGDRRRAHGDADTGKAG
jgi:diguanylate cyclase (GGDEF)-like protein